MIEFPRSASGCLLGALLILTVPARTQSVAPDADKIADPTAWQIVNRTAKFPNEGDRSTLQLDAKAGEGIAWLVGADFAEGTVELDLRGRNRPGQSFVGVAFHGLDDKTYDAVYFRPFNFKSPDPERRAHSVQYISMPDHDWPRLRSNHPGQYEATVSPIPEPDDWFRLRIVVEGRRVRVFVNDAPKHSLEINRLSDRRDGRLGLWVGNGSAGAFARLKITAKK